MKQHLKLSAILAFAGLISATCLAGVCSADVSARAANTLKYAYSPNRMFEKIAAGKPSLGVYIGSTDPQLCEQAGFAGLDYVWIDMEHRPMTVHDLLNLQMALEGTGCASLVRVRGEDFSHVKPILDIGIDGVIFPQIAGYDAAVKAVEACRYPPLGKRGVCVDRQCGYGRLGLKDYIARSATWPLVIIELEDFEALKDLERILTIKEVDGIMVGPCDLAFSMGGIAKLGTDEVTALVDEAAEKTRRAGKLFYSIGGGFERHLARNNAFYTVDGFDAYSWRANREKLEAKLAECGVSCTIEPRISVFASFIRKIAKERGITKSQAADWLYALGVRGFDTGPDEEDLPELAATKLKPINFYYFPPMFDAAKCAADEQDCLDKAVRFGIPRIMVVPPSFTNDGAQEAEFEVILTAMKSFVARAKAKGITITVEDFGGTANPCSHVKYLKRFLDEIPDIRFALDTGNLYYAGRGEDLVAFAEYAKNRIAHVHIKDQTQADNRKYATLGLGAVANEKLVKFTASLGYDGWYTLENTVGDTYLDTVRQVAVLKTWLSGR